MELGLRSLSRSSTFWGRTYILRSALGEWGKKETKKGPKTVFCWFLFSERKTHVVWKSLYWIPSMSPSFGVARREGNLTKDGRCQIPTEDDGTKVTEDIDNSIDQKRQGEKGATRYFFFKHFVWFHKTEMKLG